ncbi:MAG: hypothetical protein CSA85_00470 [Alphaproteobacteria bacterium]|nr:MAG: hypothetical protein CSA85_00470 [Alphaproteobacteria bacterium]
MFSVGEVDVKGLQRFENLLGALGADAPKAVSRAVNHTGDKAKTQVIRTLAKQTSLPQKIVRKTINASPLTQRASKNDLSYVIAAAGADISLKYFRARETRKGVTAFVRGKRKLYESSFLRGGSFTHGRVTLNMGGHVFLRVGGRMDLEKQKSDVVIPKEMVDGATRDAFERTVSEQLPRRLDHEIGRILNT